ncbi:hypothetical protein V8C86DRAFT_2945063 [Haematococcus lacustris]
MLLGEVKSEAEGVTSLAFSHVAAAGDPMWLAVGHASGGVTVWDLQRRPARLITHISEWSAQPARHAPVLPARPRHPAAADLRQAGAPGGPQPEHQPAAAAHLNRL